MERQQEGELRGRAEKRIREGERCASSAFFSLTLNDNAIIEEIEAERKKSPSLSKKLQQRKAGRNEQKVPRPGGENGKNNWCLRSNGFG